MPAFTGNAPLVEIDALSYGLFESSHSSVLLVDVVGAADEALRSVHALGELLHSVAGRKDHSAHENDSDCKDQCELLHVVPLSFCDH